MTELRRGRGGAAARVVVELGAGMTELYVDAVVEQDGERESERVAAGEFAFDNDSSPWLWRSVAFGPDLELTYRSVNVFQRRSQLVQLAVRGQDTLRGPDGDVVVWQVVVTPGVEIRPRLVRDRPTPSANPLGPTTAPLPTARGVDSAGRVIGPGITGSGVTRQDRA